MNVCNISPFLTMILNDQQREIFIILLVDIPLFDFELVIKNILA